MLINISLEVPAHTPERSTLWTDTPPPPMMMGVCATLSTTGGELLVGVCLPRANWTVACASPHRRLYTYTDHSAYVSSLKDTPEPYVTHH